VAPPGEVKRAYRRLAFVMHPDAGQRPDADRFRDRRRSYDVEIAIPRRPLSAEPLRTHAPMTILDDFLTIRPSVEELLDQIGRNFFGYQEKSGGPLRRLSAELILSDEEARFGCRVPFRVPSYASCPSCRGAHDWLGACPDCHGRGMIETLRELALEIPPAAKDGETFEADLAEFGINNLRLEVRIVVI
jgi:DnaJ-class molecular chaperone